MKCTTRRDSKKQKTKSGALVRRPGYSLAKGSGVCLCLLLGLLLLIFLAGCGPSKQVRQALSLCQDVVGQCERAIDMCLDERKTAELRKIACDQTAVQLIKCLDKNETRRKK